MIYYFNSSGRLINFVPEKVFQGSHLANRVYFVCPTARTNVVTVAFNLPNGEYSTKHLMTLSKHELSSDNGAIKNENGQVFSVWEYDIPQAITGFPGQATMQFFVDNGESTFATQSVLFLIETGAGYIDPSFSETDYQEILNYLVDLQRQIQAGINIEVVQETGNSSLAVMSQNAVTTEVQRLDKNIDEVEQNIDDIEQNITNFRNDINAELGEKQPVLTFDDAPTKDSENPVKSNGIFESIQDVMSVANGKTKTYVLSYNDTFSNGVAGATWKDIDGNIIVPNSGYYTDSNCLNYLFNSQNLVVNVSASGTKYVIFREYTQEVLSQINYIVVGWGAFASKFRNGDNIYIIETDVPDRWYAGGVQFYALEGNLSSKSAVTVNGEIVQTFNADTKQNASKFVSFSITSAEWIEASDKQPYTHVCMATLSIEDTLPENAIIELINDQPILFARHGFAISQVQLGRYVQVLCISQPDEEVTLTMGVTNQ